MKKLVKSLLSKSQILKPLKRWQQNKLVIFNYHRIYSENSVFPFDRNVYGPDVNRFKKEMQWIKKETRILSESELIDIVYHQKPINELCSMVTFDDGYADNYHQAFPILKELDIPALFFIPTYHLSKRRVGWWDVIAYFFKQTKMTRFSFEEKSYYLSSQENRDELIKEFITKCKSLPADQMNPFLQKLSLSLLVPFPPHDLQSAELMTSEQLKIMSDNGMTIGSHSHDHSILSRQNKETLNQQLQKSMEILESVIKKKVNSIAYPVGGYDHFNQTTKDVSQELGFKIGFSFLTGINSLEAIDPFNVKRMEFEADWHGLDLPLAFPGHFLKPKNSGILTTSSSFSPNQ